MIVNTTLNLVFYIGRVNDACMIAIRRFFLQNLPYLYFSLFFIGMYITNSLTGRDISILSVAFAIPFIAQMFAQKRYIDLLLGSVTVLLSLWLLLAYVSDLMKIGVYDVQAWKFVAVGGIIVVLNFVMSFLFFCKAEKHVNYVSEA